MKGIADFQLPIAIGIRPYDLGLSLGSETNRQSAIGNRK
jgi:hypothetical protein